jgi:20S proteasome alpha/beta subunit
MRDRMRNPIDDWVPRVFIVDPSGTVEKASVHDYVAHVGVSDAAHAAFDLMYDDGLDAEKAWRLALEMDRQSSPRGDAEAKARHFIELRKASR